MDRLAALRQAGVSIWLDTLSRDLLESGEFAGLVRSSSVTGATSNPTIFASAIDGSSSYDDDLASLLDAGERDPRELFFALALADVRQAADVLTATYQATDDTDGFVSFECTPDLADDTQATIEQARELWRRINRRNVMIKVPATSAGIEAIRVLTADGININVTLLFSVDRYAQVLDAFQAGLEQRQQRGEPLSEIASVASFFVSRVDSKVDPLLPVDSPLRGTVAIANAASALALYRETVSAPRWRELASVGARPQRPLWASTGTKNREYSDVLYVESLITRGVVNTMPLSTLQAFADHGKAAPSTQLASSGEGVLTQVRDAGVDLDQITAQLERDGVRSFCDSYEELLGVLKERSTALTNARP